VPVRTARGAGLAATVRLAVGFLADVLLEAGFLAGGFFAPDRAVEVEEGREVCFLALGDRVLELLLRVEPVVAVLLLREPVGEDVRVAMSST
ncbi:hypothetical protein, partial [Nocardioides sp.]|uniref:hypothetical protein n=1 Tax=Nocardioides sp. TaxID=35761 RepID=UPI002B26C75A